MTPEPSDTDEPTAVVRASAAGLGLVLRSLAPALEQVTLQQYRVLALLTTRGPMRAGDLAVEIGVRPSGVSRIVNRLARAGFVERRASNLSGREVIVVAQDKAADLVHEVFVGRRAMFADILRQLNGEERAVISRAAEIFATAAERETSLDAALLLLSPSGATPRAEQRPTAP